MTDETIREYLELAERAGGPDDSLATCLAARTCEATADRMAVAMCREVLRLRGLIRQHRDERRDYRCWMDDYRLYQGLGELVPEHACQLDEPAQMKANCDRFIASRHDPSKPYRSPQDDIDRLEAEVKRLTLALAEARKSAWPYEDDGAIV